MNWNSAFQLTDMSDTADEVLLFGIGSAGLFWVWLQGKAADRRVSRLVVEWESCLLAGSGGKMGWNWAAAGDSETKSEPKLKGKWVLAGS